MGTLTPSVKERVYELEAHVSQLSDETARCEGSFTSHTYARQAEPMFIDPVHHLLLMP